MILDLGQIPAGFRDSFFAGGQQAVPRSVKIVVRFWCIRSRSLISGVLGTDRRDWIQRAMGEVRVRGKLRPFFPRTEEKADRGSPLMKKSLKFQGSTTDCREKFCLQSKQITCPSSAEVSLPPGVVILPLPMVVRRSRWRSMEEKRNARGESVWILPPPRRYKK